MSLYPKYMYMSIDEIFRRAGFALAACEMPKRMSCHLINGNDRADLPVSSLFNASAYLGATAGWPGDDDDDGILNAFVILCRNTSSALNINQHRATPLCWPWRDLHVRR